MEPLPDIHAPIPQEAAPAKTRTAEAQASLEAEIAALRTTMGVGAAPLDVPSQKPDFVVPDMPLQPCTRPVMSEPIKRSPPAPARPPCEAASPES